MQMTLSCSAITTAIFRFLFSIFALYKAKGKVCADEMSASVSKKVIRCRHS